MLTFKHNKCLELKAKQTFEVKNYQTKMVGAIPTDPVNEKWPSDMSIGTWKIGCLNKCTTVESNVKLNQFFLQRHKPPAWHHISYQAA